MEHRVQCLGGFGSVEVGTYTKTKGNIKKGRVDVVIESFIMEA